MSLKHSSLDAASFVAAAERASNAFDLDAVVAVYAEHATLEVVADGAHERHAGRADLRLAWTGYLEGMRRQRLNLRKELLSAEDRAVTNLWRGSLGSAHAACGMEFWRFGDDGLVVEHLMWSFLDLRPAGSLRGRLRLALTYPLLAADLFRAQHAARAAHRTDRA
jgi:nuclear transport factor 2 (NTF2) superfamily protein